MSLQISLESAVVAVTGGARGVGVGIVRAMMDAGATVETCGRRDEAESPVPDGVRYSRVDVRDPESVREWFAGIATRHGRLDALVNNVGGSPAVAFSDGSARFHTKVLELNFTTALLASLEAYPALAATGGSIVNISSVSAHRASPGTAVYGAAKAALESLTRSLAVEWAPAVRVNAVRAGLVEPATPSEHYGTPEQVAAIARTVPDQRFARPSEIGSACVFLASSLSAHTTGAVLAIDGGGEWPAFLSHTPYPGQPGTSTPSKEEPHA